MRIAGLVLTVFLAVFATGAAAADAPAIPAPGTTPPPAGPKVLISTDQGGHPAPARCGARAGDGREFPALCARGPLRRDDRLSRRARLRDPGGEAGSRTCGRATSMRRSRSSPGLPICAARSRWRGATRRLSATAEFFINLADNPALDRQADDSAGTTGYAVVRPGDPGHGHGRQDRRRAARRSRAVRRRGAGDADRHRPMSSCCPTRCPDAGRTAMVPGRNTLWGA